MENGASSHQGRVEVLVNGSYLTTCGDYFGPRAAAVVCHEGQKHWLGLIGDVAVLQPPDTFGLVPNDATEVLRLYRDNYCDLGDRDLFDDVLNILW
ncbi:hypothetical protein CHLNCDRAFT_133053 [Chlorella variabilis]|uniref:SRCR domain-containing protein n=1 Tax=Chlorella variabilis TaxID=554065 RepID=E1Z290_CHLVA|nr:hypothetical protein CHLNCDRAFT_133053 [Chlorella variabilis]EFN59619.1 hypothetical protein CHLNCDRAFT_133053 [Chlorella variabilis]|eukprot:XP_005851721.1 hypothetical protein CHLNCDRAFT_133053 [Chlorella variabilis]